MEVSLKKFLITLTIILTGMPGTCNFMDFGGFSNTHYFQTLRDLQFQAEIRKFENRNEKRQNEKCINDLRTPDIQTRTDAKIINNDGEIKIEY